MAEINNGWFTAFFFANFPIVIPWTKIEKQTITYVIVTQISLQSDG
jgi:hypothetical protein